MHMTLNRLTARDARELVGQVAASEALSGDAIDQVIERTGGVPLFVEELTRAVVAKRRCSTYRARDSGHAPGFSHGALGPARTGKRGCARLRRSSDVNFLTSCFLPSR